MKNKLIKLLFLSTLTLSTLSSCDLINTNSNSSSSFIEESSSIEKKETFLVKFNTNGGSYIPDQEVEKNSKIIKPTDPMKEGSTFINWTYQGEEWDFASYIVTEDMTLDANWDVNYYFLNLEKNIDEAGEVIGAGSYNFGYQVTISAISNPGYEFNGWYEEGMLVSDEAIYSFEMPLNNLNFEARWSINADTQYKVEHYLQNIDDDKYTLYETDIFYGYTNAVTEAIAKTYEGFTCPLISQEIINGSGTTVVKVYYLRNTYKLFLNSNYIESEVTGSGTYKFGKKVTISASQVTGYHFIGWYEEDELISNEEIYTFNMPSKDINYEARYTINKYTITLINETDGVIINGVESGKAYEYNSSITLKASNIPIGYTIIWERSDGEIFSGNTYTFNMPSKDLTITITKDILYERNNNKIYFGEYPQTQVTDSVLINELDNLAGSFPGNKWIDYNYYISSSVSSFMFYQDIDYNQDGTYDYRGVIFTQYRPYYYVYPSETSYSYQDDNGYNINTIYWFSYDVIEWDILEEENGKALIISNLVLDAREFYPSNSSSKFEHNGNEGYANNYELSNIRKFLLNDFYNTAFKELEKNLIDITLVNNSLEETSSIANQYECNDTNDKLFLLSYKEMTKYYLFNNERKAQGSDYAKCQGLFEYDGYSPYWLRTANSILGINANSVYYNGNLQNSFTYDTRNGIRAACYINL